MDRLGKEQEVERKLNAMSQSTAGTADRSADRMMLGDASLSDLGDKLDLLNNSINQLVALSAQSVEVSTKQVKVTKGLSGNFIRLNIKYELEKIFLSSTRLTLILVMYHL